MPVGFDDVTIANMALSHVGAEGNIESLLTDKTPTAAVCRLWYEAARLYTLESHNWTFARKRLALATHSVAAPTTEWLFRYQMPSDCLSPRYMENPAGVDADAVPFDVEEADDATSSIVTDEECAVLVYTRDISDVTKFSMHFIHLMSLRLATHINIKVTGKPSRSAAIERKIQEALVMAPVVDANFRVPRAVPDASWIRGRS